MLNPSAAPSSNQSTIASATCSAVPVKVRWPRPPPRRPISCAHREPLPAGQVDDERVAALGALDLVLVRQVRRQLPVEVEFGRVELQLLGEVAQRVLGDDQPVQLGLELARLGLGVADDRHDARQDEHRVGVPAGRRGPPLEVGVERLRLLERLLRGEDRLGVAGGELLAVLRGPGLHQQRVALRRARHVQRPGDLEVLARVVGGVDQSLVAPEPGLLVAQDRRVVPAVPELLGDLEELRGPRVPRGVVGEVVEVEVARGVERRRW